MYCPNCGGELKEAEEIYQKLPGGCYNDIYYECPGCESKFISLYDSFDQEEEIKQMDEKEWKESIRKIEEHKKKVKK